MSLQCMKLVQVQTLTNCSVNVCVSFCGMSRASSSADGGEGWPKYGSVPLIRCPKCDRLEPLIRRTSKNGRTGTMVVSLLGAKASHTLERLFSLLFFRNYCRCNVLFMIFFVYLFRYKKIVTFSCGWMIM
jgi:hypothetical protein